MKASADTVADGLVEVIIFAAFCKLWSVSNAFLKNFNELSLMQIVWRCDFVWSICISVWSICISVWSISVWSISVWSISRWFGGGDCFCRILQTLKHEYFSLKHFSLKHVWCILVKFEADCLKHLHFSLKMHVSSMQSIQSTINECFCRHSSRWFGGGDYFWSILQTLKHEYCLFETF